MSDVADIQGGTTREGIHLGAMAGTLDLIQRCYTGLEIRDGTLSLNPHLPHQLHALDFALHYRGQQLDIHLDQNQIYVRAADCDVAPIRIGLLGQAVLLAPGQDVRRRLTNPSQTE